MITSGPPKVRMCSIQGWGKASADSAAGHRSLWRPFGGRPLSSFMGQSWIFWVMTTCFPGIQVFHTPAIIYILSFQSISLCVGMVKHETQD